MQFLVIVIGIAWFYEAYGRKTLLVKRVRRQRVTHRRAAQGTCSFPRLGAECRISAPRRRRD